MLRKIDKPNKLIYKPISKGLEKGNSALVWNTCKVLTIGLLYLSSIPFMRESFFILCFAALIFKLRKRNICKAVNQILSLKSDLMKIFFVSDIL